jgi:hypothetical protein
MKARRGVNTRLMSHTTDLAVPYYGGWQDARLEPEKI